MSDQSQSKEQAKALEATVSQHAPGTPVWDPVKENEPERKRRAAQAVAQNVQRQEAAESAAEAHEQAAAVQAAVDEVQGDGESRPDTVGDGGVTLRYLGTSDYFIVGEDKDGREVRAVAGGEPVSVPQELADRITNLPHDTFEKVDAAPQTETSEETA